MSDGQILHGANKSFFKGSSAFTRGLKNEKFNDQRGTVIKWVSDKQRWAIKLFQPQLKGQEILVSEDNLHFDHYAVHEMVKLPSHLKLKDVENCGEALYSTTDLQKSQVIFEDRPMMVVYNGNTAFESRWNLYFGTENERGPTAPVLKAFAELTDGDQSQEYISDAEILFNKILRASMDEEQAKGFGASKQGKEFIASEAERIAGVLARWQSNSHAFPLRGSNDVAQGDAVSALFRFGSKMLHSCEPNCVCTVDPDVGVMSVRALRDIKAGELITNSYMGNKAEFMNLALGERRTLIRSSRGFLCVCSRCVREQEEITQQMRSNIAKARSAEEEVKSKDTSGPYPSNEVKSKDAKQEKAVGGQ